MPSQTGMSMRFDRKIGFILLLSISLCLFREISGQSNEVDAYIRDWMTRRNIPGVSLVVIKDKKIIKSSNYGLANVELAVPVNERTSFEIASMTKQFTAAALLLLAEDGKISLDDRITKYFDNLPETWRDIRVNQLLNHTSGLKDDWDADNNFFLTQNSNDAFLASLKSEPLRFKTGERYGYSCGPFLAGMIIEKISGKSYAQFMQERIFDRLGMASTHVNDALRIVPDRASGYIYRDAKLMNGVRISPAAHARADVGIRTTALDLVKWDAAMNDTRLLKRSSLDAMFAVARVNDGSTTLSGLGWWLNPIRGRAAATHGGAFRTGFNSTINRYLDDGLTVIILANRFRVGANETGHIVAGFYETQFRSVASMTVKPDTDPGRTVKLKNNLVRLAEGLLKLEGLSANFPYRAYEPDDWSQLIKGMKALSFVNCSPIPGSAARSDGARTNRICFFKLAAEDETRYVSAVYDTDDKIAYIEPYEY